MKNKDLGCIECPYEHCDIIELPCRNCKDEHNNFKIKDELKKAEEENY